MTEQPKGTSLPARIGWLWLPIFLLGALVLYGPALGRVDFLNFDDNLFFGRGGALTRASWWGLLDPTATIANAYLPVAHGSLYLDWLLAGDVAWLPRLHSALLHGFAAFLLARLVGRLGAPHAVVLGSVGLFLAHPALVESAAWVSGRKDLLAGVFVFACLSAWIDYLRQPSRARLAWIGLLALLALYSKSTAMVLPALAMLLTPAVEGRARGAWRAAAVVLLAITVGAVGHHAVLAQAEGTLIGATDAGLATRLTQVPGALLHYVAKAVCPLGLNVLYPEIATLEAFRARAALATVVMVVSAGVALALAASPHRQRRLTGLAALAALAASLPFNTALPASSIAAADRYLYLLVPFAALALLNALGRGAAPVAGVAIAACAVLTWQRVPDFDDSASLWRASLREDPHNAVACLNLAITPELQRNPQEVQRLVEAAALHARYPQHQLRAQTWLADLAWRAERRQAAVQHAERALQAARALPAGAANDVARIRSSLRGAVMAQAAGDSAAAARLAQDALTLAPEHSAVLAFRAAQSLAAAVGPDGRLRADASDSRREALALLDRAEAADSTACDPRLVRAQWLAASGDHLPALKAYDDALALDPLRAEAHVGKVDLLLAQQMLAAAEAAARSALRAGVDDAALLSKLGFALAAQSKFDDAKSFYESYLALRPTDTDVRRLLAALLATQTRQALYQLTAEQLEPRALRVRELDPRNADADVILAMARRQQRRLTEALVLLEGATEKLPADPDVPRLLAETHRDLGYQTLLAGKERDRAVDHFVKFVASAAADMDTAAVRTLLGEECTRLEDQGVKAFEAEQLATAERLFRRCLALDAERAWTQYQLGLVLLKQGAQASEALELLRRAEVGLRAAGHDASRAVLYQIHALKRLGQPDDARALARGFVAVSANAETAAFDRIRALVE